MKKFILVFMAVVMLGAVPASAAVSVPETPGIISVSGEGRVKAMPDMAVLNIGVTNTGDSTEIQQENAEIMEKVIAAIKESGVGEKDIETTGYDLSPRYDYQNMRKDGEYEIIGYSMTHMLKVTVRDIDTVGAVLSNAIKAGANENWGINFTLSKPEEYYGEALALAVKNAQKRAKIIADTIGVTLSTPHEVREGGGYSMPIPYRSYNTAVMYDNMAVAEAAMPAPVSAGEMEITASVSLMYMY